MPEQGKGFFDDLDEPNEKKPEEGEGDGGKKPDDANGKERNLSKAIRESERRIAELEEKKAKLRELRAKEKKLKELEADTADEPEEPKPAPPPVPQIDVGKVVQDELAKVQAQKHDQTAMERVRDVCRSSGLSKADAEEIWAEYQRLPKSHSPVLDADFAIDRTLKLRGSKAGRPSPSMSTGSTFDGLGQPASSDIPESQRKLAKEMGIEDEDIEKYKDGFQPAAERLFKSPTGESRMKLGKYA